MDNNKLIAQMYLREIITHKDYFSPEPVKDINLLHFYFYQRLIDAGENYKKDYPDVSVYAVETYRSQTLQKKYFNRGASRIPTNGMHHYGIACDLAFWVDGKMTYKGDYGILRKHLKNAGLYLLSWEEGHVQYIPATGKAQNALRQAVDIEIRKFQREQGLVVDGIVGAKTIDRAREIFGA